MRALQSFTSQRTCAPTCAEHDFWAIRRIQSVQVDRLVSYPLVLFIISLTFLTFFMSMRQSASTFLDDIVVTSFLCSTRVESTCQRFVSPYASFYVKAAMFYFENRFPWSEHVSFACKVANYVLSK